jgi:hypothetical protein
MFGLIQATYASSVLRLEWRERIAARTLSGSVGFCGAEGEFSLVMTSPSSGGGIVC